jgi:Protein of unknown function (DUF4240)
MDPPRSWEFTAETHNEGRMTFSGPVDTGQFWKLIEAARRQVPDVTDSQAIAARAAALLSTYPGQEIIAAGEALRTLLAESYRSPLWAAAYMINGGCSDDGFEDFRSWLIVQGHEVFERMIVDPDTLADLPIVRAARLGRARLECEETLYIAYRAHRKATGEEFPMLVSAIQYPELDPGWDFDFDDRAEMKRRLPRLAALCAD